MFYDKFEELCRKHNVSPSGACIEMGLSKGTASYWKKSGKPPKRETLILIADYFGVSVEDLAGEPQISSFFWDRFYELCIKANTTPNAVREKLGLSNSITTAWKNGALPKLSILQRIADILNVSVEYFLDDATLEDRAKRFWSGLCSFCYRGGTTPSEVADCVGVSYDSLEQWKNGTLPKYSEAKAIADHFGISISDIYDCQFEDAALPTTSQIREVVTDGVHMIPVYESVSAGFGAYADNHIVDRIPLFIRSSYEAENTILIRVSGDSMSPVIEDGDLIQIQKQESVDSGDLAVVLLDGEEGLVKKVVYDTEYIELISLNPKYRTRRFDGEDVLRIRVVGKVRRVIRDL